MESDYEVLGVSPDADREEVRRAYRALLKVHHPDLDGSRERFLRIKEAYENVTGDDDSDSLALDGKRENGSSGATARTYDPASRELSFERNLSVQGEYLRVTLRGLVHDVDLESLLDSTVTADATRAVAFFQVQNASERPLRWRGPTHTNFGGDDGFLYDASTIVTPRAAELPSWWCGVDVDVPPERAVDGLVIAQELPEDVTVEKVIYTQHVYDDDGDLEDTERYIFEIRPPMRERLDRIPPEFE